MHFVECSKQETGESDSYQALAGKAHTKLQKLMPDADQNLLEEMLHRHQRTILPPHAVWKL